MPATDPADQQAARTIENAIREAVDRCERPPIELKWLWALPKRIRRSARLLEAAQSKLQVLLEHIRADWTRVQVAEREQEARLAQVKAQPRDLNSFDAVGKAYNTRRQVSRRAPAPSTAPVDVQTLQSTSRALPSHPSTTLNLQHTFLSPSSTETSIPSPVATPPGLREAAESLRHQIRQKNPYSAPTKSEVHSPNLYYVPELPSPLQCVMQSFDVQNPFFETGELLFPSFSCHIDGLMLTVMSYGQVALAPWEKHHTLDDLAAWVLDAHREDPGGLDILLESLFPGGSLLPSGVSNADDMAYLREVIKDNKRCQKLQAALPDVIPNNKSFLEEMHDLSQQNRDLWRSPEQILRRSLEALGDKSWPQRSREITRDVTGFADA
ncbi:hypothetical protein FRC07_015086 [Ceratobasidium sp. 392]|nr:hypothetical protein FRC07_015086 [Ceratobasidium sp. 392]